MIRSTCAAFATGTIATSASVVASTASTPTYRFVKAPIVPIEEISSRAGGGFDFDIYAKINRPLPRSRDGAIRAVLALEDSGGGSMSTLGRRSHHCFAMPIDASFTDSAALKQPAPGRKVQVRLMVAGKVVASTTVRLSRPLKAPGSDLDAPYAARLRC